MESLKNNNESTTTTTDSYLYKTKNVNFPGFSNNPLNVLTTSKQLPNILKIETRQLTREIKSNKSYRDLKPLIEYQLWLEAGKLDKANFKSQSSNENANICFQSNVWRNFKNSCGLKSVNTNSTITESIASLYPMNIPVPSQLGSNTLAKYYKDNNLKAVKTNENLIKKLEKEAALMKYLRLKSELRNPPMDMNGRILPPANYNNYQQLIKRLNNEKILSNAIKNHEAQNNNPESNNNEQEENNNNNCINLNASSSLNQQQQQFHSEKSLASANSLKTAKKLVFKENHPNYNKVIIEQKVKDFYKELNKHM